MNIEDIKKMLETAKYNSRYDNFPLSKEEVAIEYLLSIVEHADHALWRLSTANIPASAHIFKTESEAFKSFASEALKAIRGN